MAAKQEDKRNRIIELMMEIGPLLKRSLIHPDVEFDLSKTHFPLLHILQRHGSLPMSDIGKRLHTSKPHITMLSDKLIKEGLAEREASAEDRRVINLKLTEKGKKHISGRVKEVSKAMNLKLAELPDADTELLFQSLENIKQIIQKLK
ncbi:MAG: MarR family transcriptional regulator [Bacteroidetes bacterium]|nr:MarR family transcriptional regulator [Bacteroidota bacterium]